MLLLKFLFRGRRADCYSELSKSREESFAQGTRASHFDFPHSLLLQSRSGSNPATISNSTTWTNRWNDQAGYCSAHDFRGGVTSKTRNQDCRKGARGKSRARERDRGDRQRTQGFFERQNSSRSRLSEKSRAFGEADEESSR